jgi:homoserine dehydrogenase
MKTINIGLIGAGTIGKGVIASISENADLIEARTGIKIAIRTVCDKFPESLDAANAIPGVKKTSDWQDVIRDPEIDIVVELIGGLDPAKNIVIDALKNKKSIVTANKALLSESWKEIFATAKENEVSVGFEGSVGGAIPVIKALRESFVANNLEVVYGILNGTTNFILTMMGEHECSFEKALATAQKKGIAESNPALDISGKDSAHKLAILTLLGFGIDVSPQDIFTEGIEKISRKDIEYAKEWGYSIKLLAIAKRTKEGLQLRVHPTLISDKHLLAGVKMEDNAIFVKGDFADEALLHGKGAGSRPTASSVISDVVEIAKNIVYFGKGKAVPYNPLYAAGSVKIVHKDEISIPYYLRFSAIDKPGVLAGISSILAENNISIASMSQEERNRGQSVPVIMITHNAVEGSMQKAIAKIESMDHVTDKTVVIRIEE